VSHQIIQQPNGMLAVHCSVTDTIVAWDATEEEIVEFYAEQAWTADRQDAKRQQAWRALAAVLAGEPDKIYHVFTLTWAEALELDREHDGIAWREAI
jgi:GAF domain-containing protein